jgi:hypothetical protein
VTRGTAQDRLQRLARRGATARALGRLRRRSINDARHLDARLVGARGVDVAVDMIATYRLVRLALVDDITLRPRNALLRRFAGKKYSALLDCPWCLSVWVAFGVAAARSVHPRVWGLIARALAFSAVTGLITEIVDQMEDAD